jgi:dienelactone hydrolase
MRRMLLALLFLLPWPAAAQPVSFPGITVGPSLAGPEVSATLYKPAGSGPFPAIILAHSCAGLTPHTGVWQRLLSSWGYLVLVTDSFGPRGEKAVCTKPGTITPNMRVADVAGALQFLSAQPDVAHGKVGIVGHSHGGSTTIRSLQKVFGLGARGLRGGVAYYPGCSARFDYGVDLPLLLLTGDKDDWTPADRCRQMQAAAVRPELIDGVYYPDAWHSFDVNARDRTVPGAPGNSHFLSYDPAAARDAEARTKAFFEKILR